ncbi:RNA-binding protein [Schizosaccharomyces japonicus yFS275]|uniref:RNA-binding protein n=1 Tax=Schizosaccharomyces japonicus (strain yFS275 / FY16936) TaxID=402676 RepID=B6JZF0_SCHJY|nr:RNA-binding protein [Schizosaccharomyces japonicus yFS275]EEB06918.1 RNA-binding protein [Schizosaccharomyces japonicus yFS275]
MAKAKKVQKNKPLFLGSHVVGGKVGKTNGQNSLAARISGNSKTDSNNKLVKNELYQRLNVPAGRTNRRSTPSSPNGSTNKNKMSFKTAGSSVSIKGSAGPTTVVLENLAPGTSSDDVVATVNSFGEIMNCQVNDSQGKVRAFVRFTTLASCNKVVEQFNGITADGHVLSVYLKQSNRKTKARRN